jgi:hypothetical protein
MAGANSPAEYTNDHNPAMPTTYHMDAADFCTFVTGPFIGVIFDPPYSYRQISEHYKVMGKKTTMNDTNAHWYSNLMDLLAPKIAIGGHAITFGWNSNGFSKQRGFEHIEILLVAHGGHNNDTIVTVEEKVRKVD